MSVFIRPMGVEDREDCQELWQGDPHICSFMADSVDEFRAYIRRNPGCSQVAVNEKGQIIGALAAGHDGFRGSCHHLMVAPQYRRQGIGRRLAQAALQALREEGISRCFIWVYNANTDGGAFWRDLGFEAWEDCPTYSLRL